PGFLWPKLNPPSCGYRLAITGAIKDTAFDYADIALFAADYLLEAYPEALKQRFQLDELPEQGLELMDIIGVKRGCMRKGGVVDLQKTGSLLISEIRTNQLGPITLETPAMIVEECAAAEVESAAKAAEKAEREKLRQQRAKKKYR
ncbi:MAG: ribosome biogenesis GTPase YlqF, partial [Alkalimonas sp.]|nr:ribosome biogenesis GTPase YlqF [Alkalimonas sp.]